MSVRVVSGNSRVKLGSLLRRLEQADGDDPELWVDVVLAVEPLLKRAQSAHHAATIRPNPSSRFARRMAEMFFLANRYDKDGVPQDPSLLLSMLVWGGLGGAASYLASWPVSLLLPERWNKERLRRTALLAGALVGATPGLFFGFTNLLAGKPFFDVSALNKDYYRPDPVGPFFRDMVKQSQSITGLPVGDNIPPIPRFEFHQTIWEDPRVAGRLTIPQQAAASGLVEAAAGVRRSGSPRFVTPMDMARVTAGMGSGYLSGWVVGKALGALLGAPQDVQDRLKNTGMWAGAVANLLPIAFGR